MEASEIQALLAKKDKPKGTKSAKGYAWVRNPEGTLDKVPLSQVQIGRYEGRAGSIRRSRKGAVRRLANGRRYFVEEGLYFDREGNRKGQVISYKANP